MSEESSSFSSVGQVLPSIAPNRIISEDELNKLEAILKICNNAELEKHENLLGLSHQGDSATRLHAILHRYSMDRHRCLSTIERCVSPLNSIMKSAPRLSMNDWHMSKDGIIMNLICELIEQIFLELAPLAAEKKAHLPKEF